MQPKSRYNEALSFIEQGLEDISISRSSITWGVPVPWDTEQVIYVWVDALINYLSALTYARPGEDLEGATGRVFHLMAKDILKFHAVIWPALLMSAGYEVPTGEFIHGYLLMGGEKMSKTRGNVLDPFAVMETYGLDAAALLPLPRGDVRAGRRRSRSRASSSATRTSSPTSSATS